MSTKEKLRLSLDELSIEIGKFKDWMTNIVESKEQQTKGVGNNV